MVGPGQKVVEVPGADYIEVHTKLYDETWHISRYDANGQFHCPDKPAYEDSRGCYSWYRNGRLHREGEPAQKLYLGAKEWQLEWWLHGRQNKAVKMHE